MPATTSSRKLLFWALAGAGVIVAAIVAVAVVIVATGRGGTPRAIGLKNIPLVAGTRVLTQVRSCDRGANPYCALQVVIVGDRYPHLAGAAHRLRRRSCSSWAGPPPRAPTATETAADSPGHELRLTFATAYEDLLAIDLGWIQRTAPISHSLSATHVRPRAGAVDHAGAAGSS